MKIIIAHASAGQGHKAAADSLFAYFKDHFPQHQTEVVDILDVTGTCFSRFYSVGYHIVASRFQPVWAALYALGRVPFIGSFFHGISRVSARAFIKHLKAVSPDAVITTHFFPAEIVSYLRQRRELKTRLYCAITDFGVHPFWVVANCDAYFAACEHTAGELQRDHVPKDAIKVFGIPIKEAFACNHPVAHQPMKALLMTGSFGFSYTEQIVNALHGVIDLYVVCGKNNALLERLKRKKYERAALFGFTSQIPLLMSEVDILITKPGGVTIAEALSIDLPMLFIKGIPGQETQNAVILESYGCAIRVRNTRELKEMVMHLKTHPELLQQMKNRIQVVKKPFASKEIAEYVCQGGNRAAG
jgi:processive 1,2-diacylglycerol beta-glucosyltransferase